MRTTSSTTRLLLHVANLAVILFILLPLAAVFIGSIQSEKALQADTRREGLIALNAVIRNRARFAQDYPSLELTLTDEADRPVLRRVIGPRDYLEAARRNELVEKGIAPGGETTLRLLLDSSRARATGYRLYLFYPS